MINVVIKRFFFIAHKAGGGLNIEGIKTKRTDKR